MKSTEKFLFMAGGGGAFYMGGFIHGTDGQGGPDLSIYYRPWQLGLSGQAGYGSAHQYGQLTMFKSLDFTESMHSISASPGLALCCWRSRYARQHVTDAAQITHHPSYANRQAVPARRASKFSTCAPSCSVWRSSSRWGR